MPIDLGRVHMLSRRRRIIFPRVSTLGILFVVAVAFLASIAVAPAAAEGPHWQLSVTSVPTHLSPGGEGQIDVLAWNLGGESEGAPVTITDSVPAGLVVTSVHGAPEMGGEGFPEEGDGAMSCAPAPVVACTWSKATAPFEEDLTAYGTLRVRIGVKVQSPPGTVMDEAQVEGGEAETMSVKQALSVDATPAPFGFERYEVRPENANGSLDTQAGSHPYQLTTTLNLNSNYEAGVAKPVAMVKDLHIDLPPGLLGNPTAVPECTVEEFTTNRLEGDFCPPETAVGVVAVTVREPVHLGTSEPTTKVEPLFNLTPAPGEPARLGFVAAVVPVVLDTSLRTGEDYGVTVSSSKIPETAEVLAARVTVWGVPGDPAHDSSRGWGCLYPRDPQSRGGCTPSTSSTPYLTLPTSCTSPLESEVEGDSWPTPSKGSEVAARVSSVLHGETGESLALTGCERLPFSPTMTVAPDTHSASSPSGLKLRLSVPQTTILAPHGLAEADVKDTTVELPEGMQVNPSSANGLEACSETGVGFFGLDAAGTADFSPSEAICPDASKVGVVRIKTPLLSTELEGGVYLAAQTANPFGSLLALYIVAHDTEAGVLLKLAGEVKLNGVTGRLVSSFQNTPQLPFEDLNIELFGGAGGALATPARCGRYEAAASLVPWSGGAPVRTASSFEIASGADNHACPGASLPFRPSLAAGTTDDQAGAFSPFTTTISREDGEQSIQAVSLKMPPGLSGILSSVTLCEEARAEDGLCGPESLIGETTVSVGVGDHPYTVTGGKVYITGPYDGAPFGLSIATPAKAGPFDLERSTPCDCLVVRAKVEVDPHTAQLTITTDGKAGSHPIPRIIEGIPLEIKQISVTINRPGFTFNPTDCRPLVLAGQITSTEEVSTATSDPFQAADCAGLSFAPKFSVSTSGHASKQGGASLTTRLVYPTAPPGSQANIATVKVDLPRVLPSRLTTLQKACLAAVFEADPANCPAASIVGQAVVTTPLLPVPLRGPAYFVSHGGEAFPSLTLVLQGYGVTIDLVGTTFIKDGVTSTTFKATPDAPFESFELTLPEGGDSALAATLPVKDHYSFCGQKLTMPTAFTAQNGAEIHRDTPIAVEGCSNRLSFTSSIRKKTLTLAVYAPAGGKITASGNGLTATSRTAKGQEDVTFILTQKRAGKLKTTVRVTFKPTRGRDQSKDAKLTFEK
jgi:hypothetical protein